MDIQTLQQQLSSLREQCDAVIEHVSSMRDGTSFFANLQEEMDALEQAMARCRTQQRTTFDTYVVEEKLLTRDLNEMLERLEEWEQDSKHHKLTVKPKPVVDSTLKKDHQTSPQSHPVENSKEKMKDEASLVKRVRQLDSMILHLNSQNGGWDDREHALFTSTLSKCGLTDSILLQNHLSTQSSQPQQSEDEEYETLTARFLRRCMKSIVTKSEKAVRQHLEWYINYILLVHEKKETIAQWKQQKEHARELYIQQGLHNINEYVVESLNLSQLVGQQPDIDGGLDEGVAATKDGSDIKKKKLDAIELEQRRKERARTKEQLKAWKKEKETREEQKRAQDEEEARLQAAQEAKHRQQVLEKKQQVLLYKLQKEQANAFLNKSNNDDGPSSHSPARSPGLNEELRERSRKAIQQAKERRAKLEAIEQDKLKQGQLPDRPPRSNGTSPTEEPSPTGSTSSNCSLTLHKPTKAMEAKSRTKMDVRRMDQARKYQGAHEAYFSGASVITDVKLSSFGHKPIAPRAVPSWRRNLPV